MNTPLRARVGPLSIEQPPCNGYPKPSTTVWQKITGHTPAEHVKRVDIEIGDGAQAVAFVDTGSSPRPGDTLIVQDKDGVYECLFELHAPPPSASELIGVSLAVVMMRGRSAW
jgi:hypothetical protein